MNTYLNIYRINLTSWDGEGDIFINTSLSKEQVTKVLKLAKKELQDSEDYDYNPSYFVNKLIKKYPKAVIIPNFKNNIDIISI